MMSFLSRLFGSGSNTATVEPTVTETFTPLAEDFLETTSDFDESPAVPTAPIAAPKPHNRFALPEEPQAIGAFLARDHKSQGYHDAFHFPQASRREMQMSALQNEFREAIRGHVLLVESYIRKVQQFMHALDQEGDAAVLEKLRGFVGEANAIRLSLSDELVQLELKQGRGAMAISAYELGFHEGLSDLTDGRQDGLNTNLNATSL